MDSCLSMEKQAMEVKKKCFRTLRNICKIIRFLLSNARLKVIDSLVVFCLHYCNGVMGCITARTKNSFINYN